MTRVRKGLKVGGGQSVILFYHLFQRFVCGSRFQPINKQIKVYITTINWVIFTYDAHLSETTRRLVDALQLKKKETTEGLR